jgi:DNA-directed RNA polymerase omega subunit
MTYIPVNKILDHIPNKFEAIRVIALECRRLNAKLQAEPGEPDDEEKITSVAVERLIEGEVQYFDARERREEERSEAMLAAAEGLLDTELAPPPAPTE